jgi:hypothetical protein
LAGVRTTALQAPTVIEAGEHHKVAESISEYLDVNGDRIVTTNRFVVADGDEALAELERPTVQERGPHRKRVRQQGASRDADGTLRLTTSTFRPGSSFSWWANTP